MNKDSRTYSFGKTVGTVFAYTFIGVFLGFVVFIPYLFLWSINILFSLGIPYTFETYIASLLLFFFVRCCGIAQLFALRRIGKKKCCGGCK